MSVRWVAYGVEIGLIWGLGGVGDIGFIGEKLPRVLWGYALLKIRRLFTNALSLELSRVSPRRANYFLCFAKESSQRKATALCCPCGVPNFAKPKMGSVRNSLPLQGASSLASEDRYAGAKHASRNPCYTSNNGHFFIHFRRRKIGSATAEIRLQKQSQKQSQ
jgi:hypothetical protein